MFTRGSKASSSIASASREALRQPRHSLAVLADGTRLRLRRLSWIEATLLWEEFGSALLGLLAGSGSVQPPSPVGAEERSAQLKPSADGRSIAPPLLADGDEDGTLALPGFLAALPALTLRLAALCAGEDEAELGQREACDVLAIAAAALRHNFIAPRGATDFFAALAELAM